MPEETPEDFPPVALVYSAPSFGMPLPIPTAFYNAFPDLNDVAPDRSRSAFPKRAKYLLPLHCILNPCATYKRDGRGYSSQPRDATNERAFQHFHLFEWVHEALAATKAKLVFRLLLLGPFYTTLDKFISSGRAISVPLIRNPDGNELQRLWSRIARWFELTRLTDELYSLIGTIALISYDEEIRNSREKEFVAHENEELPGFAELYWELKDRCEQSYGKLESCTTTMKKIEWATQVLEQGRKVYEDRFPKLVNAKGSPEETFQHFDNVTRDPANQLEAIQWLIGYEAIQDKHYASFPQDGVFTGKSFFAFDIAQKGSTAGRCRIVPHLTQRMVQSIMKGVIKGDGSRVGKSEVVNYVTYMVFLEAIRQQICWGVGLRCPFWTGKCCGYSFYKELLARVWEITKPRAVPFVEWQHHWQRPPCLA